MTMQEFAEKHRIGARFERVDRNPNFRADDAWSQTAWHWKVILSRRRRRMTTHYSQGKGNVSDPTVVEILNCLAIEATEKPFKEWCHDLGYNPDSIEALRLHNIVVRQTKHLMGFLCLDGYDELIQHTEQL